MEDALFLHQTLLKGGEWWGLCSYNGGNSIFEKDPFKGWRLGCEYFLAGNGTYYRLKGKGPVPIIRTFRQRFN
jgi:hypothetical protein